MKKKALLISLIALAMALCMFAGATIAYLFVVSQDVVNTFAPSNIELTLVESDSADTDTDANKNEYQMIPGATITKDPKVSASADIAYYVFVKVEKSANVDTFLQYSINNAEWTALTIPTHGTGNSWDFVDSGFVDLTAFAGKNIQIGFKYTSTAEVAPTWEIKNVKVLEKPADVVVPEGTEASVTFSELGYENAFELEGQTIAIGDNVSCQFFKNSGSTAPKYYTTGTAARLYAKNTIVISSEKTIKYIKFTVSTGQAEDNLKADGYDAGSRVWTGESKSITFTQDGSTGHTRIQTIELVYAE